MKILRIIWAVLFGFILAAPVLWLAGFLLGIANLQNPIKTANHIVRTV